MFAGDDCITMAELKIGWERKIILGMSSGTPLVGEKDLQPSETKNEWTTKVGIIWIHDMVVNTTEQQWNELFLKGCPHRTKTVYG